MSLNFVAVILPRPILTSVPTMFLTIYRKKPSASIEKMIKPSSSSVKSALDTLRIACDRGLPVPSKDLKSWAPTIHAIAFRIAGMSSFLRMNQAYCRPMALGTLRFKIL